MAARFVKVLELAGGLKLARFGQITVSLDGTKVAANPSKHAAVSYERAGQTIARLELEVPQAARRVGLLFTENRPLISQVHHCKPDGLLGSAVFRLLLAANLCDQAGHPTHPMNALLSLWLPILLSAVVVFIISSLIHMVFKWHTPDYKGFANEDDVRAAINAGQPSPGQYALPYCTEMKELGSESMKRKFAEGPVGFVRLAQPGPHDMTKSLGIWFLFTLFVTAVAAYLAVRLCGLDPALEVRAAKLVGAVAFIGYGFGAVPESIWMARPWTSTAKYLIDAAIYGLASGLVFWWLWP